MTLPGATIIPCLWAFLAVLAAYPPGVRAQSSARVRADENFRREPNGVVLARLAQGAPLRVHARRGNWTDAEMEGWVWLTSLRASDGALDLVVALADGENLRSGPRGDVIGRLEEGTLLEELGREPDWAHVRRRGWIWSASVDAADSARAPAPQPGGARGAPPASASRPEGFTTVGGSGAPILSAPDGDTLALARPAQDLQVLSRDGSWARVRVEGWIWLPTGAVPDQPAAAATPLALEPADLAREPDTHVGRVVAWGLQFISLERAEEIRTDFREGEPFLLTRYGGPEGPFVYVAVPPERLDEMQGLVPLERVTVTARVRTGASSFTGAPIVDLLSVERRR
jgi:hypothetical protein